MMRTRSKKVTFGRRFVLGKSGEELPPGTYDVETDEELLEGVSFPVFRRVATLLHLQPRPGLRRTLAIDPADLDAALERDRRPAQADRAAVEDSEALKNAKVRRQASADQRAVERGENEGMTVCAD